ncbi:MAG: DNA polymerase III subunit delta' [Rhizobiaceae bacterium]
MNFEPTYPPQHDGLEGVPAPAETPFVVGHEQVAEQLVAAYRRGKLPHAVMFCGHAGIGKATLAFHIARYLLAHPDPSGAPARFETPGPSTPIYRQVAGGAHPSVLHLTRPPLDNGKGFRTQLTVDEVRRVSRFLSLTSHDGGWRIVIVDPADDLNRNAANALLKSLEEPPARTIFILVSHLPGRLLPTIRSRCQVFRLQPLAAAQTIDVLERLGQSLPAGNDERLRLAEMAAGSPRTAMLLAEHGGADIGDAVDRLATGAFDTVEAHRLADAVAARDGKVLFDIFNGRVLAILETAASTSARGGDVTRADALADTWQAARNAITEAESYNLDRKLHALTMIERLNAVMRM